MRIQPDSEESHQNLLSVTKAFKHAEAHAIQPRETMFVDLTLSEEILLSNMKQKHRYNLKIAQREGVQVEHITKDALKSLDRFWKLLTATSDRHTFRLHTKEHYASILSHLGPKASLAFATKDGQDVAALMLITENGVATYLHGGSIYEFRSLMAPYLLHWRLMVSLKAQGFTAYDFWGVHTVGGDAIKGHASEGVSRFKLGFGGILHHYAATVDVIFEPFRYSAYKTIQRFRSRKRAFA
jgi:lipid II:glycine glycyltransferase (peptidoglycan interpeptide bridge formation enzyme)